MKLSTNHIVVSDLDTPRKDLLVWLVSPPKYGHIENTKKGETWLGEGKKTNKHTARVTRCYICRRLTLQD